MTTQHTPRPWNITNDNGLTCFVGPEGGAPFAKVFCGDSLDNARLIAAAPELLAALKCLYSAYVRLLESGRERIVMLGGQCDQVDAMERSDPNLRHARAVIAKAQGV